MSVSEPPPPVEPPLIPEPQAGLPTLPGVIVADAPSGMTKGRSLALLLLPVLLGAGVYAGSLIVLGQNPTAYPTVVAPAYYASAPVFNPVAGEIDGAKLYTANCVYCHGERGDGRGVAQLTLKARHFGFDKFKFASTRNGVPTDDDIKGLLRRGLPGSPMPAFPRLTDDELTAIAGHVRYLTQRGAFDRLVAKEKKTADDEGEDFNLDRVAAKLSQQAAVAALPGDPLAVPAFAPSTPESLENGRKVFLTNGGCAACHGPTGKGDGPQAEQLKNEDGTPNRPRDLTAGLFKGGREAGHVYARVMLGIPGTPMPAAPAALPTKDVQDLVGYVLSLSAAPAAVAGPGAVAAGK